VISLPTSGDIPANHLVISLPTSGDIFAKNTVYTPYLYVVLANPSCLHNTLPHPTCSWMKPLKMPTSPTYMAANYLPHNACSLPGLSTPVCIFCTSLVASGLRNRPFTFCRPVPKQRPHTRAPRPKHCAWSMCVGVFVCERDVIQQPLGYCTCICHKPTYARCQNDSDSLASL